MEGDLPKSRRLYRGVRRRNRGKWGAVIYDSYMRTQVWLGIFETEEEAAQEYDMAALRLHGSRARLNFPHLVVTLGSVKNNQPLINEIIEGNQREGGSMQESDDQMIEEEASIFEYDFLNETPVFPISNVESGKVDVDRIWDLLVDIGNRERRANYMEERGGLAQDTSENMLTNIVEGDVATEKQHNNSEVATDNRGGELDIGEISLDSLNQPLVHMNDARAEENIVGTNEECIINSSKLTHRRGGIDISREELEQVTGMKRKDAAERLNVSVSTFKRVCREYHISRWPPHIKNTNQPCSTNSDQTADCLVTIKAKYGENFIKFQLSASSGVDVLNQEVSKRLKVEVADYIVKYQDEDNDWILVACDDDLQGYISSSLSSGKTTLVMFIEHI